MMCHCKFIDFNNYTTLVGVLIVGEAMGVWGQEFYRNFLYV